jgi:hypothetical protein
MHDAKQNTDFLDFLKEDYEVQVQTSHPVLSEIDTHRPQVESFSRLAAQLAVKDAEACSRALDLTSDIKDKYQELEAFRKKTIEPSRKFVQMVNEWVKVLHEQLTAVESEIKYKIASYQKMEQDRLKAAEETIKQLSESLGIEIAIPGVKQPSSEKAVGCYKETTSFEVVDKWIIPDEYWTVDEKAIQKHIDMGKIDIPGIKLVKEKKFFIRRK